MSVLERFLVTGKVAVITGAGRGIGAASALALAQAGADVVISARTEEQLIQVADQVAETGRKAHIVVADLSAAGAPATLTDAALQAFGRLDIVVNNVGGAYPRPLLDTSTRFLEEAFRFNVSTAHALTVAAVPAMLATGGGAIINISSVMGRVAGRGYAAYGTAKAALTHYSRLAATDLAPSIRVNAIAVGSVATSALDLVMDNDQLRTAMEDATPLHRIGDPADIAATVVYLASPAGSFVTGKVLEVDGGLQVPNLDLGLPDL
jgi:7-alpha-hydroxysteroid dehydrogenase